MLADHGAQQVNATLERIKSDFDDINSLVPEYTSFVTTTIEQLVKEGDLVQLYGHEDKFKEYKNRYESVKSLL